MPSKKRIYFPKFLLIGPLFVSSLAVAWVLGADQDAERLKFELRPRTDKNLEADLAELLEYQRRNMTSQIPTGLSELANRTSSTPNSQNASAPSSTTSNSDSSVLVIGSSAAPASLVSEPSNVAEPYRTPDLVSRGSSDSPATPPVSSQTPSQAGRVTVSNSRVIILEAPRVTDVTPVASLGSSSSSQDIIAMNRWRPVSAQITSNDAEASVVPSLDGSIRVGDPGVISAAYQAGPSGMSVPGMGVPSMTSPPSGAPSLPSNSSPNILPSTPTPTLGPAPPTTYQTPYPTTTFPTTPFPSGQLPTYNPPSGSAITSGEPFVTSGACQFDASYMVEPACYAPTAAANGCGSSTPYPYTGIPGNYTGIPGNIVPPTMMPNQVPPGLYQTSSAGHRPLIGFGQDNYNVQLGRGIIGQPVAYVVGQPFRNFLRYVFP